MKLLAFLFLAFPLFNFQDYQEKVVVLVDGHETITYAKSELEKITSMFPELIPEPYPMHPDEAYDTRGTNYTSSARDATIEMGFNSEAGQDKFYILYAYFLKQKNGVETYRSQREQLVTVYRLINHINRSLTHGGTYYSHQHYRIHGYAEYAIYSASQPVSYRQRDNDIRAEKNAFLESMKEIIEEELEYNDTLNASQKASKKQQLMKVLSELDGMISNRFFLKNAREFQDTYY